MCLINIFIILIILKILVGIECNKLIRFTLLKSAH